MEKYIVVGQTKIPTDETYNIGDRFFTYNLTPIKCTKIEEVNSEILYHFSTNENNFNIDEALNVPMDVGINKLSEFLKDNYNKNK